MEIFEKYVNSRSTHLHEDQTGLLLLNLQKFITDTSLDRTSVNKQSIYAQGPCKVYNRSCEEFKQSINCLLKSPWKVWKSCFFVPETSCMQKGKKHEIMTKAPMIYMYIDWCCFYYFVKNGLVVMLETLYTWISVLDSRNRFFFINKYIKKGS